MTDFLIEIVKNDAKPVIDILARTPLPKHAGHVGVIVTDDTFIIGFKGRYSSSKAWHDILHYAISHDGCRHAVVVAYKFIRVDYRHGSFDSHLEIDDNGNGVADTNGVLCHEYSVDEFLECYKDVECDNFGMIQTNFNDFTFNPSSEGMGSSADTV